MPPGTIIRENTLVQVSAPGIAWHQLGDTEDRPAAMRLVAEAWMEILVER